MTEPWEETIGHPDEVPGPYFDCWERACPACKAAPLEKCRYSSDRGGERVVRLRHAPCLARVRSQRKAGA